ncbi:cytochrome P450 [Astrocystis sublimbata]|nr:cytochrome P450 [Astrocystis sublimbata]
MAAFGLLIFYLASGVAIWICLVLSYRLLLHPLRHYPGPLPAKLSGLYVGVFSLRRRLHLETYKAHLKYGPVVRLAPNRLVFNTARAFQDIYQNDRIIKSYVYSAAQPDQSNIFTTTEKSEHRPKRRLISQLLSDQSMRQFEPTMSDRINMFLKQLLKSSSEPVNMTPTCRHLGLEIAGLLGFGYDLNLQRDDRHRYLTRAITLGNYRVNACLQYARFIQLPIVGIMNLLPNSLRGKLMGMISTMITTRLAEPVDARHDLLSVFHSTSDMDVRNLRQGQLWTEAVFFFVAGGETIATALAATFFYLSRNEECYKKLAEEIRSTFSSGAEIRTGSRLSGCRYLRACIDESLRMSPPVPTTLWREAAPSERSEQPLIIDGHVIPPGTQIGVNIYSLRHNKTYFPEPFRFFPDRWLEGKETGLANHDAFVPFSVGQRGCAGKAMAYLEMSLVLAKTLWYFDFEAARSKGDSDGLSGLVYSAGEFPIYDLFAASHDGPGLVFRPRDGYCEELRS